MTGGFADESESALGTAGGDVFSGAGGGNLKPLFIFPRGMVDELRDARDWPSSSSSTSGREGGGTSMDEFFPWELEVGEVEDPMGDLAAGGSD